MYAKIVISAGLLLFFRSAFVKQNWKPNSKYLKLSDIASPKPSAKPTEHYISNGKGIPYITWKSIDL